MRNEPPATPKAAGGPGVIPRADTASAGPGFESLAAHRHGKASRVSEGPFACLIQEQRSAYPVVIFTVQAPETVRPSTSSRTSSSGTVKLSPTPTGASARGG